MQDDIVLTEAGRRPESIDDISIPANFARVGEVREDDVRIYITQATVNRIDRFASQDLGRELGGVLVGKYTEQMGKRYVVIEGILEAKHTDSTSTTLTFTHETWATIHAEKERDFPGSRILGWFHTHPRFGIFLSSYDLFIQQNYFNIPWQIAYVVDPVAKTRGFYIWRSGEIVRCEGFFLYDGPGKQVIVPKRLLKDGAVTSEREGRVISKRSGAILLLPIALLIVVSVVFILQVSALENRIEDLQSAAKAADKYITTQQTSIDVMSTRIAAIESTLTSTPAPSPEPTPTEAVVTPDPLKDGYRLYPYTVAKGDTLAGICARNALPGSAATVIAVLNGIENPNAIQAGQVLLIPGSSPIK